MRLYELAYCCHVYTHLAGYDSATVELRAATGVAVNPGKEAHLPPLFNWLRRWGCRQFAIADEHIARESLTTWWVSWCRRLPSVESTLDEIDDAGLDTTAGAFEELRGLQASWQNRETSRVAKTFGPAGAAKTLYAIRPNACSPWDEAIRTRFGLSASGEGYRHHLVRVRAELSEAIADLGRGGSAAKLPALLDRSDSSPAKLVDEHDWARFTRGFEPPEPKLVERWAGWAALSRSSRSA